MASLVSGRRITVLLGFVTVLVLALGNPSTTSAAKPADWGITGDWRLVINTNSCTGWSPILEGSAFCGPFLSIGVPPGTVLMWGDRNVYTSGKLTGLNGPVPLYRTGTTVVNADGSRSIDRSPGRWQSAAQNMTPTGLPYGTYAYEWTYMLLGEWSCSIYLRSVCVWLGDSKLTKRYTFEWNGVNTFVYPPVVKRDRFDIAMDAIMADYKNCIQFRKDFSNGVAKSKKAAAKQKQAPMVFPALYDAYIKLDRDKDGTVCEK